MEHKHTNRITRWLDSNKVFIPQQVERKGEVCDNEWWEFRHVKRQPITNYNWLLSEQIRLYSKGINTSITSKGTDVSSLKVALFR